jgi:hypothetical protein
MNTRNVSCVNTIRFKLCCLSFQFISAPPYFLLRPVIHGLIQVFQSLHSCTKSTRNIPFTWRALSVSCTWTSHFDTLSCFPSVFVLFIYLFSFCYTWTELKAFCLQAFYHLRHTSSPGYFSDRDLHFLSRSLIKILPTSTSQVARITVMTHGAQPTVETYNTEKWRREDSSAPIRIPWGICFKI